MKSSEDWHGTAYELLTHNCNHFSDSLVNKLTGSNLPAWINRTAAIGNSLKFLVPASLIGLDEIETDAQVKVDEDRENEEDSSNKVTSKLSQVAYQESHSAEHQVEQQSEAAKMAKAQEIARKLKEKRGD